MPTKTAGMADPQYANPAHIGFPLASRHILRIGVAGLQVGLRVALVIARPDSGGGPLGISDSKY